PSDASSLLDTMHIPLDRLRGRSSLDPVAQAAEIFLRRHSGNYRPQIPVVMSVSQTGQAEWTVTLVMGERHAVVPIEQVPAGYATFVSCGDEQPRDVLEYRLVDIN